MEHPNDVLAPCDWCDKTCDYCFALDTERLRQENRTLQQRVDDLLELKWRLMDKLDAARG